VLINVDGDEEEAKRTMEGLTAARAFIRTLVRGRLGKQHIPEITFHLDRSQQVAQRIDELLHRVEKRKKKSS
jgi:ribosome-binding factor A